MSGSLWKIPFLAVAAISTYIIVTPPMPPASRSLNDDVRIAIGTRIERFLSRPFVPLTFCICLCAEAIVESLVIIAQHIPTTPVSQIILHSLIKPSNTGDDTDGDTREICRIRTTPTFLIGCLLMLCSAILRRICYRALGRLFTFQVALRADHKLITSGPYAWVRHPSYTGVFMSFTGNFLWIGTAGSWVRECGFLETTCGKVVAIVVLGISVITLVGLASRLPKEDALLKSEFGKEWEAWARDVRHSLVPGVY